MPIPGGDVHVGSAVGASNTTGKLTPLVQLTVESETGESVTLMMRPGKARGIGLDLIAAAAHAPADTALRLLARQIGVDGDGLIHDYRAYSEVPPDDV